MFIPFCLLQQLVNYRKHLASMNHTQTKQLLCALAGSWQSPSSMAEQLCSLVFVHTKPRQTRPSVACVQNSTGCRCSHL